LILSCRYIGVEIAGRLCAVIPAYSPLEKNHRAELLFAIYINIGILYGFKNPEQGSHSHEI
jgi:hypothetical protein